MINYVVISVNDVDSVTSGNYSGKDMLIKLIDAEKSRKHTKFMHPSKNTKSIGKLKIYRPLPKHRKSTL